MHIRGSLAGVYFLFNVFLHFSGDTNDGAGGGASGGVPFHNKTSEEKEKLYSKIAQKLITIADAFSAETGLSDSEAHHKTGYQEGRSCDCIHMTAITSFYSYFLALK